MLQTLYKLFPLFDHLYIFQNFEYSSRDFFKWFLKNINKRNLQKKHKLEWTQKAILFFVTSLFLIILSSLLSGGFFFVVFLILLSLSPIFLIISNFLYKPLETYLKQQIISKTKEKLSQVPNLKVVGITGSFGKTSTKDILYTLLFKKYYVVKTPKSFNTLLGVAQTVLDLVKENTDIFICEIGAYKKGEIKNIASLVKPVIGIITAVAPQHLERFGSLENIATAKFELAEGLPKDGLAILNGQSDLLRNLASNLKGCNVNFYGRDADPYFATNIKIGINGTEFTMHTPKGVVDIQIPLIGEHHVQNFLAATTAAMQLGLTLSEIKIRAKLLLPTPHRMEIKKIGNMTFIDNSYNTNPKSAESSLALLASFEGRKIVITPGFVELGKEAAGENQLLGQSIACLADEVIIVGEHAKNDLLDGIKKVWKKAEERVHFVNSTQEGLTLATQLGKEMTEKIARHDTEIVVLLENDLPDQYN